MSCPDDLKATVGATLDCTVTTDRQNDGVNVTVSSVNGGTVNFDIIETVNFDIIETVSKDDIAGQISKQLNQQFGHAPEFVTCPDNLKGTVGATLRCTLTDCNWTRTDGYSAHP